MKIGHLTFLLIILSACSKQWVVEDYALNNAKIDSLQTSDQSINSLVIPFKNKLDEEMNSIVAYCNRTMKKQQPEGTLGNLMADAAYYKAKEYTNLPIDLAILNYGGIRIPSIEKGAISLRQLYELMPFDNFLVILKIDGATLKETLNRVALYGGWPISNASFAIQNQMAENIIINGEPLNSNKQYYLAISDYVANGGDKMAMLKPLEQINTGVFLRDAIIEYVNDFSERNENLNLMLDNRIVLTK